jgi:predicted RNA binding protein YcfA (HicA-like mRNA interferase family)
MLTNSRDIVRRLDREKWTIVRVTGSHHVFKNPNSGATVVVPHPKKDLGKGLVRAIYKGQDGSPIEVCRPWHTTSPLSRMQDWTTP